MLLVPRTVVDCSLIVILVYVQAGNLTEEKYNKVYIYDLLVGRYGKHKLKNRKKRLTV
jgi:hypothetical protein